MTRTIAFVYQAVLLLASFGASSAGCNADDDHALRDFVNVNPGWPIEGVQATTCAEAVSLTGGLLCAHVNGPYSQLQMACNASCNACENGPPPDRTCEQYGIGDRDDEQMAHPDNWYEHDCRKVWGHPGKGVHGMTGVGGRNDAKSWGMARNLEVGFYAQTTFYGMRCPVSAGWCRTPTRIPTDWLGNGLPYWTYNADNTTFQAELAQKRRGPIKPGSPAEAALQIMASRDFDRGGSPALWLPFTADELDLPICQACTCNYRSNIRCDNPTLDQHNWIERGMSIPDGVTSTYMVSMAFTVMTRAVTATITTDVSHLDWCHSRIDRIENGAFRNHFRLVMLVLACATSVGTWSFVPGQNEGLTEMKTLFHYQSTFPQDHIPEHWHWTGPNASMGRSMPKLVDFSFLNSNVKTIAAGACCDRFPELHMVTVQGNPDVGPSLVAELSLDGLKMLPLGIFSAAESKMPELPDGYFRSAVALTYARLNGNRISYIGRGGFPEDMTFLTGLQMIANPSVCYKGTDIIAGGRPLAMTCDCAAGLASDGGAQCQSVRCTTTVPVVPGALNAGSTSSCNKTIPGSTCTVVCPKEKLGNVDYTCGADGLWAATSGEVLDCKNVLPTTALGMLIEQPITFEVPSTTVNVTFDPTGRWANPLVHHGREHYNRTGTRVGNVGLVTQCVEPASVEKGTLLLDRTASTVTVDLKWREDRDVDECSYSFEAIGSEEAGYHDPQNNFFRNSLRLTQASGDFYDRDITFSGTLLIGKTAHITTPVAKTVGQFFTLHTSTKAVHEAQPFTGLYFPLKLAGGQVGSIVYESLGPLPGGLKLNATTGDLSGIPARSGVHRIRVFGRAYMGGDTFAEQKELTDFRLSIAEPIVETGSRGLTATVGSLWEGSLPAVTGGLAPLVYSFRNESQFTVPAGLEIDPKDGRISGVPRPGTATGRPVTLGVQVTDANGHVINLQTLAITVVPAITMTWERKVLPTAVVGEAYAMATPTLVEGHADVLYRPQTIADDKTVAASALPAGLSLNYGNGQLYGTPTKAGVYTIHLLGTDGHGRRAEVQLAAPASDAPASGGGSGDGAAGTTSGLTLTVLECDRDVHCSSKGSCDNGDDDYDGAFTCICEAGHTGERCEAPPSDPNTLIIPIATSVAAVLLLGLVALRMRGAGGRRRLARVKRAVQNPGSFSKADLTETLHEAIELGKLEAVPGLVESGADPSQRSTTGQLAHAALLQRELKSGDQQHAEALHALFLQHCEIDAQIGAGIRGSTAQLLQQVLQQLARAGWRSRSEGSTVAHVLLAACAAGNLDQGHTVALMDAMLEADPAVLTTPNLRKKTPSDVAMLCSKSPMVERRYTVIVFGDYQIPAPETPMYKSPTAEVHECVDLRVPEVQRGQQRLVLKLIARPHLWLRELEVRTMLAGGAAATGVVSALSAALVDTTSNCAGDQADAVRSAAGYAASRSTEALPITAMQQTELGDVRRAEARRLMQGFPYALCMPLADRNLLEIIQSERLAEEPIAVIRSTGAKVAMLIHSLHANEVVHGDIKPKNIVRVDRELRLIDFDMAFKPGDVAAGMTAAPHADKTKLSGSTAYAAPELIRWMAAQEQARWTLSSSPLAELAEAVSVDLWSFAATLYEMATSVPLFAHSYDRVTATARSEMIAWGGLTPTMVEQLQQQHGRSEAMALEDLLQWSLDADPTNRPRSMGEVLDHAFFNPERGSLREDFAVQRLRDLLKNPKYERTGCNVMISYCWADTQFVLGKLAPELAVNCKGLWLDRLGGDQGMGEWAVESMQRGVQGADVVLAVVSPAYVQSKNCGVEMQFAAESRTTVLPIVLGVPFIDWPPRQVGSTVMVEQFASTNGDLKIFVDMSEPAQFHTKFNRELLPRLVLVSGGDAGTKASAVNSESALFATDRAEEGSAPPQVKATRPRRGKGKKVAPASASSETSSAAPVSVSAADLEALRGRFGPAKVDSGEIVIKGNCPNCGTLVTDRDPRELHDGKYWLKKCYDEKIGSRR